MLIHAASGLTREVLRLIARDLCEWSDQALGWGSHRVASEGLEGETPGVVQGEKPTAAEWDFSILKALRIDLRDILTSPHQKLQRLNEVSISVIVRL